MGEKYYRVTPAMADVGEGMILSAVGDAVCLSGFFSARELAVSVWMAMSAQGGESKDRARKRGQQGRRPAHDTKRTQR